MSGLLEFFLRREKKVFKDFLFFQAIKKFVGRLGITLTGEISILLAANDMIEENTGASPTPHNPLINPAISAAAIHKTIETPKKTF